ncbi:hypothetical protein SGFS_034390 [Streptomyces graminofaciens]|uniref:Uncharacterized protein n=1 Tax=Streptomyces graminofaciens TaxID=68212 RepID=A0ABM7F867_9ACTN|nr:hypothetical protein SGFS_034390 [Streptomyces graminofaciens]
MTGAPSMGAGLCRSCGSAAWARATAADRHTKKDRGPNGARSFEKERTQRD